MTLKVEAHTLPTQFMRHSLDAGDWYGHDKHIIIPLKELGNSDAEFLVLLHELIEAKLCMKRGIAESDVTKFDLDFTGDGEPGDDPSAPYHKEHVFATAIEMAMCEELGINPDEYEKVLESGKA